MTGAQKCSHVHGMAWVVGIACSGWMARVLSAAWEYVRGVSSAILGERRTCCGARKGGGDAAVTVGSVMGVSVGTWAVGGT